MLKVEPDIVSLPSLDKLLKSNADGISLTVKVSPKSHRNEIKSIVDLPHGRTGLAIRVCPPAADGAANEAVVRLLARLFEVPSSSVEINSGTTSRVKTISVKGPPGLLQTRLLKALA